MLVLPNILLISHKKKLFDMPDKRKVHHAPVPRLGGLVLPCDAYYHGRPGADISSDGTEQRVDARGGAL